MNSKTWLAVSTHSGEYEEIKLAHDFLKTIHSNARLILAPRHPERFKKFKHWFVSDPSVSFNETLGEMDPFFDLADAVFLGGTLDARIGGHNLLEPIARKKPTLVGPHVSNIDDILEAFPEVIRIVNGMELGRQLAWLFSNPQIMCDIVQHSYERYLKEQSGILRAYLDFLVPVIDGQINQAHRQGASFLTQANLFYAVP